MLILVSAQQADLDSLVDDRFGRAEWYIKFDSESKQWQALENPGVNNSKGAGVAAAQFVVDQSVDLVISGDFGPNAASALKAAGVKMVVFGENSGSAREMINLYQQGSLATFQ
jgi:predicted Fe-Mo cluster-binding NifX family protein